MPRCNGITARGERCRHNAIPGETSCRVRHATYMQGERCIGTMGHPCDRNAEDGELRCRQCINARQDWMQEAIQHHIVLPQGDLEQIAHDKQNVHTQVVVKNTIKAIEILLKLNPLVIVNPSKKACAELIVECPLTVRAICDFTIRYWSTDVTIYDMGPGIYFQIVNAVWDFTKKSPHREDICKIIATELDDSVGMCAQGALSRLCNILAGYVEGIGEQRSAAEILGDALASIAKDSTLNLYKKLNRARAILEEHKIPREEWDAWLDPIAEEGEEDYLMAWKMAHEL